MTQLEPQFAPSCHSASAKQRRGSAVTEYALLLVVIACSVLFGARLIGSHLFNFKSDLSPALASNVGEGGGDRPSAPTNNTTVEAPGGSITSTICQLGTLVALMAICIGAFVSLRKSNRTVAIVDPELGGALLGRCTGPERFAVKRQEIYRVLCRNLKDVLTCNVTVEHILSNLPMTVLPNEPVENLAEMMKDNQIRHLLVCDEQGKLVGVVSDRDVSTARGAVAGKIMTPHPSTVSLHTDLRTAISIMLKNRFSSLPVVEDERLVGIVTVTDLIIMLQVTLQLLDKFNSEVAGGTLLNPDEMVEAAV